VHFLLAAVDDDVCVAVAAAVVAAVVLVIYHYYTHYLLAVHTYDSQHAITFIYNNNAIDTCLQSQCVYICIYETSPSISLSQPK
jgi:hypothetical protein